jgi:hypothetical protein
LTTAVALGEGIGVEEEKEEATGSAGTSSGRLSASECKPTGCRGRRRVPLLGSGVMPRESQTML